MLKNELLDKNSIKLLENNGNCRFGAVLARAGVGKTAFVVQLSLNCLLQNKNVLHISLNDPVKKLSLWYKELFYRLSESCDKEQVDNLWEELVSHRFIMTFQVEGFSVPKLKERLTDLTEQNIFVPEIIIIDGLPFDDSISEILSELKKTAQTDGFNMWFTIKTHRHEEPASNGMPVQLNNTAEFFDTAVQLLPDKDNIEVKILKGDTGQKTTLFLDPATMILKK